MVHVQMGERYRTPQGFEGYAIAGEIRSAGYIEVALRLDPLHGGIQDGHAGRDQKIEWVGNAEHLTHLPRKED